MFVYGKTSNCAWKIYGCEGLMMVMLGNDKTNIKTDGQVGVVIDGMSRGVVELYNCGLYIRLV